MARHHMTPDGPVPFTPEEEAEWDAIEQEFTANSDILEWTVIRAERNQLIAKTDWTQLPDAALTNTQTAEWASYRQALRDITTQSDPFNIAWPMLPSAGE